MDLLQPARIDAAGARPVQTRTRAWVRSSRGRGALILGCLGLTLLVSYWTTLGTMADRWRHDPQYSHGFLVPAFAAAVLWFRRDLLRGAVVRPCWWGVCLLGIGLVSRLAGAVLAIEPVDAFSLLPTLAGLALLLGGWAIWRWSWPAIVFLAFMLPVPYQFETALAQPLRRLATTLSTYVLQTLGFPALAEGNIIHIDQLNLGVIDACSGLGMLITFFALATAMAMVVRAPMSDRIVVIVSAVPIALIANIARITATAVAHYTLGEAAGKAVMHDLAGLLMMPLALVLLWLELRLLGGLFVPIPEATAQPLSVPGLAAGKVAARFARLTSFNNRGEIPSLPAQGNG